MLVSFGILTLLLTGGCSYKHISHGSEITHYEVAKIVDGKTNKEEIFILSCSATPVKQWIKGLLL